MSVSSDVSATLRAQEHGHQPCVLDISHRGDVLRECGGIVPSLCARAGTGGNNVPCVYRQKGFGDYSLDEIGSACKQRDGKDATDLVVGVDCYNQTITGNVSPTLRAIKSDPDHIPCVQQKRVRRLTPLECERLQGYPDHWTDIGTWYDSKGKKHETSDAARYKALGNSIALPPWKWVLKRLCAQYERDATMASLFDGIGGFPLLWEQMNGEGSCLWASEIEEFPMAVTKLRFSPTGQKG